MSNKRRIYIADHGQFTLFDMNISLPAIIELTEEQISYLNTSGLYKIEELSGVQTVAATPTLLSSVEGDRFERARTISVNELSFKAPIMGSTYANKAKNAIIVTKNSIYAQAAIKQNSSSVIDNESNANMGKTVSGVKEAAPATIQVNSNTKDMTRAAVSKHNKKGDVGSLIDGNNDIPSDMKPTSE